MIISNSTTIATQFLHHHTSFCSGPSNPAAQMIDKFPTDLDMMACVRAGTRESSSGLKWDGLDSKCRFISNHK